VRSVISGENVDTSRVNKTESIIAFARTILRRFGLAVVMVLSFITVTIMQPHYTPPTLAIQVSRSLGKEFGD